MKENYEKKNYKVAVLSLIATIVFGILSLSWITDIVNGSDTNDSDSAVVDYVEDNNAYNNGSSESEQSTEEPASSRFTSWETSIPDWVNSADYIVETKTQYSYRDKETTTSNNSSLSGWTLASQNSTGYSDWSSWSSWSTTAVEETDLCDVETKTVDATYTTKYRYTGYKGVNSSGDVRFHYCLTCAKEYLPSYSWSSISITLDSKLSSSGSWSCGHSGSGRKYVYNGRYYYQMGEVKEKKTDSYTQYRYRTRSEAYTYNFYRWTSWSDYSDTRYTSSSTREVRTRTLYRYKER